MKELDSVSVGRIKSGNVVYKKNCEIIMLGLFWKIVRFCFIVLNWETSVMNLINFQNKTKIATS